MKEVLKTNQIRKPVIDIHHLTITTLDYSCVYFKKRGEIMKKNNAYEQNQAEKKQAYAGRSKKLSEQADALYHYDLEMARNCAPYGQPVFVGHHSEQRQRNRMKQSDNRMRKMFKLKEKSEYYEQKANLVNRAISSDDEEAMDKLKAKLEKLELHQEKMKRINDAYRKHQDLDQITELSDEEKENIKSRMKRIIPRYMIPYDSTYLAAGSASIRRIKKRITSLEYEKTRPTQPDIRKSNYTIREVRAENRIYFIFDEKPDGEVRSLLKLRGFKWSPVKKAWMRMLNANGRVEVKRVIEKIDQYEASVNAA